MWHHVKVRTVESAVGPAMCVTVPDGSQFFQNGFSGWNCQGSEFPVIVMPLMTCHYTGLARNLLYTGVTRAKRLVVLIADPKALKVALGRRAARIDAPCSRIGCGASYDRRGSGDGAVVHDGAVQAPSTGRGAADRHRRAGDPVDVPYARGDQARHIAMYLAHVLWSPSYADVARAFGRDDTRPRCTRSGRSRRRSRWTLTWQRSCAS